MGRLGAVLERFERRLGSVLGGVMGRLGTSLERLQPDFRTKVWHSVWDVIFYSILVYFNLSFRSIRTREKVLQKSCF